MQENLVKDISDTQPAPFAVETKPTPIVQGPEEYT